MLLPKYHKAYLILVVNLIGICASAQETFHAKATITFEKTVYVRKQYKELNPESFEQFKAQYPEVQVSLYQFTGDALQSVYLQTKEAPVAPRSWYQPIAEKNVVYNDYATGKTITQKPVFEETFLLNDSLLRIRWKLTADRRTIAGYDCRKAIGLVDDTLAVFAFYTDELLISGGPEGIQGLPGMILGVGIPRLHTTWFATKVEVNNVNTQQVKPATKGKPVDRKKLISSLDEVLKNMGTYGRNLILNFVI